MTKWTFKQKMYYKIVGEVERRCWVSNGYGIQSSVDKYENDGVVLL